MGFFPKKHKIHNAIKDFTFQQAGQAAEGSEI